MVNYTARRRAGETPNVLASSAGADMLKKVYRDFRTGKSVEIRRGTERKPKIFRVSSEMEA